MLKSLDTLYDLILRSIYSFLEFSNKNTSALPDEIMSFLIPKW